MTAAAGVPRRQRVRDTRRPGTIHMVPGLPLESLRDLFTDLSPGLHALIKRWKRGVCRTSQRVSEPPIRDLRGPVVGTIATVQTFLTPSQIDQIVDDYLGGATVADLAVKYEVHRATVSRHLTDKGVVRRPAGLHGWKPPKLFDCSGRANRFEGFPSRSEPVATRYGRRLSSSRRSLGCLLVARYWGEKTNR